MRSWDYIVDFISMCNVQSLPTHGRLFTFFKFVRPNNEVS